MLTCPLFVVVRLLSYCCVTSLSPLNLQCLLFRTFEYCVLSQMCWVYTVAQPTMTPEMEFEAKRHQELSNEIQDLTNSRQKQLSQLNENTMVKQEMDLISGEAVVYKKIGPTLVKQDLSSAKDLISKRMEFVERSIKSLDKKVEAKQGEMQTIETRVQALQEKEMKRLQQAERKN